MSMPRKGNSAAAAPRRSGNLRVLVVDDSRLQRRILTSSLKRNGFEIWQADTAEAALEICARSPPDLVLSDWMMPGMSGLEFCRAFRAMPREGYGYFILLTSKSEKIEIAQGLDAGADDFLTKPVNPGELRARIKAGERILSMHEELTAKSAVIAETLGELQALYDSIDADLKQAKKIQESLVPARSQRFGASHVSLLLKPCGHIGGDLVGMFTPDARHVGVYGIDVSGHGITSAMMTARLAGYLSDRHLDENLALRPAAGGGHVLRDPSEVACLLNERLLEERGIEEYFTLAYAVIDLKTGDAKMVQAGHPHPLLLRAGEEPEFLGEGGLPIGLLAGMEYGQVSFRMGLGDRLLLYSDGFTECCRSDGTMLDSDGLLDLIASGLPGTGGQEFLDDLFWRLTQQMPPEQGLDDDVSAALFEFRGA